MLSGILLFLVLFWFMENSLVGIFRWHWLRLKSLCVGNMWLKLFKLWSAFIFYIIMLSGILLFLVLFFWSNHSLTLLTPITEETKYVSFCFHFLNLLTIIIGSNYIMLSKNGKILWHALEEHPWTYRIR